MQISDQQIQRLLDEIKVAEQINSDEAPSARLRASDGALIARLVRKIDELPDREDRIAVLKARIDAGNYNVSGDDIVEAMVRRAIADRAK